MPRLAHHVFFTLHQRDDAAIDHLIAQCQQHLTGHDGMVGFDVGRRDRTLDRPVNGDFDVSLHTIFDSRQSHDDYQTAERHLAFIEANKASWASVQVFDSFLED